MDKRSENIERQEIPDYVPYKGDKEIVARGQFQQCTIDECRELIFQEGRCLDHWLIFDKIRPCGQPRCKRLADKEARNGYCKEHYKICDNRNCGGRIPEDGRHCKACIKRYKKLKKPRCTFLGCKKKQRAKGFCRSHWEQNRAGKRLTPLSPRVFQTYCNFGDCDRPHFTKGLCKSHDTQRRRGKALTALKQSQNTYRCTIENCNEYGKALGYCTKHYQRFKKAPECPTECKPAESKLCDFHIEYYLANAKDNHVQKENCKTSNCKNPILKDGYCRECRKRHRKKRTCSVKGCTRKHKAKGFCGAHYHAYRNKKKLNNLPPQTSRCMEIGCAEPIYARRRCAAHYTRFRKENPHLIGLEYPPMACSVDDCNAPVIAKDLCNKHYSRMRNWGTTDPKPERKCSVEGCEQKHIAKGYCSKHYQESKRKAKKQSS